jgi:hypothetical protein
MSFLRSSCCSWPATTMMLTPTSTLGPGSEEWRGSVRPRGEVGQELWAVRVTLCGPQEPVLYPDSVTHCYLVNAGHLEFSFQAGQEREAGFAS